jgi:lysophospholipid acyltransferase (LPLAT)-like uncharacterized protein
MPAPSAPAHRNCKEAIVFDRILKNRNQWISQIGGSGTAFYMRHNLKWLDTKIAHYDVSVDPGRREYNEHCIHVFWHEYIIMAVGHWANTPVTMLVSQHRDATWLTEAADKLGFRFVRGSTTRGGSSAIRQLKRYSRTSSIGITPDGPRGPRRRMAMGAIFLASMLKMPVVPVGFGYDRPLRLNTWDKFAIPKPLRRARVVMGPKIRIPPRTSREKMEQYRRELEKLTTDLTSVAEDWAASGKKFAEELPTEKHRRVSTLSFGDDKTKSPDIPPTENCALADRSAA